jgi:hypothetical protein
MIRSHDEGVVSRRSVYNGQDISTSLDMTQGRACVDKCVEGRGIGLKFASADVDKRTEPIVWNRHLRTFFYRTDRGPDLLGHFWHDTRFILFISTAGNFAVGPTTAGEADPGDGA